MRSLEREELVDIIVRILTPFVGTTMARASTLGMCDKHGLNGPRLDREQARRLTAALAPGLNVFIGRAKAESVAARMANEIDAALGAP